MNSQMPEQSPSHMAALDRVGVIDIGSNSVRLVVFDGAARSPAYFYNEKILCGLGKGFRETGVLNPEGYERAILAMRRFAGLARRMHLNSLTTIATAAVRDATDGPKFCAQVKDETGIEIEVASGKREARLSAQGILLGDPEATGLVCDIGGSSMELAELASGVVGQVATTPLGPLQLVGMVSDEQTAGEVITAELDKVLPAFSPPYDKLFLVGGSWRAIAKLDMAFHSYPLHVLNEYRATPERVLATLDRLEDLNVAEMMQLTDSSETRMSLVKTAAMVLRQVLQAVKPPKVYFSSYGLREGLLYERMSADVRALDPVLEACRFSEQNAARFPGFGDKLADWLKVLFPNPDDHRLLRAACLLHDVGWRSHPDYRAEQSFENATRANLGGLSHRERLMVSLALHYRYKSKHPTGLSNDMYALLPDGDWHKAELLGKAIRFGALSSGDDLEMFGFLSVGPQTLDLLLADKQREMFGEVVEKRFKKVAAMMGLEPKFVFKGPL